MRANKRDDNEREFVEAWRALGALWIPQSPGAGFDGLLIFRGQVHIVEVKDIKQGRKKYELTVREEYLRGGCEWQHVKYEIVTNMTEALKIVDAE